MNSENSTYKAQASEQVYGEGERGLLGTSQNYCVDVLLNVILVAT